MVYFIIIGGTLRSFFNFDFCVLFIFVGLDVELMLLMCVIITYMYNRLSPVSTGLNYYSVFVLVDFVRNNLIIIHYQFAVAWSDCGIATDSELKFVCVN